MMKCMVCRNELTTGKKFCGFCGVENPTTTFYTVPYSSEQKQINIHKPPRESEKEKLDTSRLARQNASIFEKIGAFIWIGFLIFAVLYGVGSYLFGKEPISDCKRTTKEVQTIIKIDGGVDSIKAETVYGCEYPDGSFYEYSD